MNPFQQLGNVFVIDASFLNMLQCPIFTQVCEVRTQDYNAECVCVCVYLRALVHADTPPQPGGAG